MNNLKVRLTERTLRATSAPATGALFLRDNELRGFGVRITSNDVRSFILEKRINGKPRRITLGRVGELSITQARAQAVQALGQLAGGIDPFAQRHKERLKARTLDECYADFLRARKGLKPTTLRHYESFMQCGLAPWRARPLSTISKDAVETLHRELGEARGPHAANGTMRFLRSLFNYALAAYDDADGNPILRDNPVLRLTRTRAWFPSKRRQTVLKHHQLPALGRALDTFAQDATGPCVDAIADYVRLLLYTGLRRSEAARLRWADVDLAARTLTVQDPKNGHPLTLPLAGPVQALLERRAAARDSEWVFPGTGRYGHLIEPKKSLRRIYELAGFTFGLHDLRRTFATAAESLDLSPYTIKRLMNHAVSNDVTLGYIVADLERLRVAAERIADHLSRGLNSVQADIIALPFPRLASIRQGAPQGASARWKREAGTPRG